MMQINKNIKTRKVSSPKSYFRSFTICDVPAICDVPGGADTISVHSSYYLVVTRFYPVKIQTMADHPYFFIRINKKYIRIDFSGIRYIESGGNYVRIFTDTGTFLTTMAIKQLEKALPAELFCRVNRGSIVPIDRIICFDRDGVILGNNVRIAFSDRYRKELEAKVTIIGYEEPKNRVAVEAEE
jgi:hypothetical protein